MKTRSDKRSVYNADLNQVTISIIKSNHKQANLSITQANFTDFHANQNAIQANQSADFHSD